MMKIACLWVPECGYCLESDWTTYFIIKNAVLGYCDSYIDTSPLLSRKPSLGHWSIHGVHTLPLPNLNAQCTANNRKTGKRCKNPAAYGCKTCRYHGARRNILKGTEHPNYKHGNRTKESMATYSNKVAELDHLEAIAHSVGIMEGPKRAGRKPKIK